MHIRVATGDDVEAIARIHVAAWQVAYRGLIPDAILESLDAQKRAERWREVLKQPGGITFVAESDENIIGFCNLIPSRDSEADPTTVGEIASIYIHPRHWRIGIGRKLASRALAEAKKRQFVSVTVWVLTTNASAIKFYEAMGFVFDGATKTEQLRDVELQEIRVRVSAV